MQDRAALPAPTDSLGVRLRRWCLSGQGRPVALIMTVLLACGQGLWGQTLWEPVRLRVFDAYQRAFPRPLPEASRSPVVIIDIDEASLKAFGQWPWPHAQLADLIGATHQLGASTIGLDILLVEADRLSPTAFLRGHPELPAVAREMLEQLPRHEAVLAAAIQHANVAVGRAALLAGETSPISLAEQPPMRIFGELRAEVLRRHYAAHLTSLPMLEAAASGRGYLTHEPDHDGVVRTVPLVLPLAEHLAPTLALELVRLTAGKSAYGVEVTAAGIRHVYIGAEAPRAIALATDATGHWRPHFSRRNPAWRLPAWRLLAPAADLVTLRQAVQDKIALIGVTGLGLADVVTTPVEARIDGVEVQAQVLENLLHGVQLVRPASMPWWELGLFLVLAVGLVALLPSVPPGQGVLIALASACLVALCSAGLFVTWRLLVDPSLALGTTGLVLVALLTSSLTSSQQRRQELQAALACEQQHRSRVEGELQAAHRIQMGMLPAPWAITGLPAHLALHAMLQPAKEVGGDLYDAFMLDDERFCFLVGDVAGKGVPASLFMALSKTLCKSLALRAPMPLEQLITALNQEVSRDNAEGLFVTMLAGILNVRTGSLELCSAGHEAPILLRQGEPPRVLEVAGGPPLCVLETFVYPASVVQLQSGDLLLMMTDGVSEAHNRLQTLFGAPRVLAYCQRLHEAPEPCTVLAACQGLYDAVQDFIDGAEPFDDITIMALRFTVPSPEA